MKRKIKKVKKDLFTKLKKQDQIFVKGTISFDDPKNQKYFDDLSYQLYLISLNNESDNNEE